ncbi:unnamed protein product [Rangifer tarandus platyrhynchus]|uniref:Uncharacterized protein n=1 Tax=Rangifer tarandus platyrhynchus TaxID=3082113 RepID=A0ABN8YHM6_RANTA|nr:unnamed protein product [Rangifer tarandus platyrhynchus]
MLKTVSPAFAGKKRKWPVPAFKVMLAWVFFFPGHKGNNHWLALFLKGKFLFNFFFFWRVGWWGWELLLCHGPKNRIALLQCVWYTHRCVSVCSLLPAAASCFSGTHMYNLIYINV